MGLPPTRSLQKASSPHGIIPGMTFGITATTPSDNPNRITRISVRLPRLLHEQVQRLSGSSGESVNTILVQAVQQFLGEGGPATEDRIADLEQNVTRAVTAFGRAVEDLDGLKGRVERMEQLARQSGANI